MLTTSRIFVAGHRGLVGSAVVRRLEQLGFTNVLTATRDQLDLRDQAAVKSTAATFLENHAKVQSAREKGSLAVTPLVPYLRYAEPKATAPWRFSVSKPG